MDVCIYISMCISIKSSASLGLRQSVCVSKIFINYIFSVKDKEQCKLDIVNLKSKISLCWGQETEVQGGDATSESTARLTRQLEDLEERLVLTQEQLDDAMSERDTYKAKVRGCVVELQGGDVTSESTAWLTRQLKDLEERPVLIQEQINDALSERDTHKAKLSCFCPLVIY